MKQSWRHPEVFPPLPGFGLSGYLKLLGRLTSSVVLRPHGFEPASSPEFRRSSDEGVPEFDGRSPLGDEPFDAWKEGVPSLLWWNDGVDDWWNDGLTDDDVLRWNDGSRDGPLERWNEIAREVPSPPEEEESTERPPGIGEPIVPWSLRGGMVVAHTRLPTRIENGALNPGF